MRLVELAAAIVVALVRPSKSTHDLDRSYILLYVIHMNIHVRSRAGAKRPAKQKRAPTPGYISIRDLQKLSAESIAALAPSTAIKSGDRTVALLTPLKKADPRRLRDVLRRAKGLNKGRDSAADDTALSRFGDVDPSDWNKKAIRKLKKDWRARS